MEQMKGVEPSSQPWQGRVLAVKPHLHVSNYNKKVSLLQDTFYIINFF